MKYLVVVFLAIASLARAAAPAKETVVPPKPEGIDLNVTVIERTPRYPAYAVGYEERSTHSFVSDSQKDVKKRWPASGEEVTFTGRIANKGTEPVSGFKYIWLLDGKKVDSGDVKKLGPGEYEEVTFKWNWVLEPHVIELVVDPDNEVKETFEQNNRLVHDTMAKLLHLKVSTDTYNRMNNCPNLIGTYSCEDQLNWYMTHMNEMSKNAIYLSTPNGCRERVRAEFLVVEDAAAFKAWYAEQGGSSFDFGIDGGWWHDYKENTAAWCRRIDWGLPHELGHQLGLIDLYRLDLAPERNLAPDEDGDPIMIGRGCDHIGMMRGHGPVPWSEHSAAALETHLDKRRGFYGSYLTSMPEKNYIQLLDNRHFPFDGAKITAYQTSDSGVLNKVVFSGVTGKGGRFLLPNRSINRPRYITELGYEYHDNPFGAINAVGVNSVLFFRIEARGHTEYKWLEITHLNLAYWRGQKDEYTHVYQTNIPHSTMPAAPKNITAKGVEGGVKITWDKVPGAPAVSDREPLTPIDLGTRTTKSIYSYSIWRAYPGSYQWKKIGTRNDRDSAEFIDKTVKPGMVRYAVTAVNGSRDESAFSNTYGYSVLRKPTGICAVPNGRLILADGEGKLNQLVYLKPNGSTIGPWNSCHCHSYSRDVAIDKDGTVAFIDWTDGYDSKKLGFWYRKWDDNSKGRAVKKELGSGEDQIARPQGISFDEEGNVILTDAGNNRVDCYKRNGERLWRVDTVSIDGNKTLNAPSRAILWQKYLTIADTGNDRVVLTDRANGQTMIIEDLKNPRYVIVDEKDRLVVSDSGNGALKVYAMVEGRPELVSTFTGTEDSKLGEPIGITYIGDDKYVIVDSAERELVYVTEKELLASAE